MTDRSHDPVGWLARLLRVRAGERRDVRYFALLFLMIGGGIAIGRGSADALFLKRYGIAHLPAVYGVLSAAMAASAMLYAAFADRLAAERLMQVLLAVLTASLLGTAVIMEFSGISLVYPAYYLVYEVAAELLIMHAAFYVWQNFESQQAKRLVPLLLAAGQIGTVCGGLAVAALVGVVGANGLVLVWAALAISSVVLVRQHHQRRGPSRFYRARRVSGGVGAIVQQLRDGLAYTRESSLLRAASVALLGMVITFYILSYSVSRIYAAAFAGEESLGAFLGVLTAVTSAAAIGIQLFVTGRLVDRFGLQRANLVYPISNLGVFALLALTFTLPAALLGSVVKEVLLPAIRRPVRNLFFNALPDELQGRARALSMAVVLPLGLAAASGILLATQGGGGTSSFLAAGFVAAAAYLVAAVSMNRAYVSTLMHSVGKRVFVHGRRPADVSFEELAAGVKHSDDAIALGYARRLVAQFPARATTIVLPRLSSAQPVMRDRLLRLLAPLAAPELAAACEAELDGGDPRLLSTALHLLFDRGEQRHAALIGPALANPHPRVRAAGIHGAIRLGPESTRELGRQHWHAMLRADADADAERMAGLDLLARFPRLEMLSELFMALNSSHPRVHKLALYALARMPAGRYPALEPRLRELLGSVDWEIRQGAVRCLPFLHDEPRELLALASLEDSHPGVRAEAIQLLDTEGDEGAPMLASLLVAGAGSPRAQQAMLQALHRRGAASSLFTEVAALRAADAAEIDEFLFGVESELKADGPRQLLGTVLAERRRQFVALALDAMRCTPDSDSIDLVRAALFSGDPRQRANGVEILRNLGDRRLARHLGDLIDHGAGRFRTFYDSAAGSRDLGCLLKWCAARPDPWLRRCARQVAKNMQAGVVAHG